MHNLQKRFINRFISRVYIITKSKLLRLGLMNLSTKLFLDYKNKIEYDDTNKIFWLKNGNEYLLPVEKPYFDFHKNRFDERALDFFCQNYIPKKDDLIVDVGAGIGTELCFFSRKIREQGKLYSIEACPNSFRKLKILAEKNNFKNCFNFNIAISDSNGEIWIEETDEYYKNKTNKISKGIKVLSYSFDQFVTDNQIDKINYLKVNIEGAEYDMVDGMKNSIGIIENIALSCHDFLYIGGGERIKDKIMGFLTENNFELFYRNTGDEILDSWIYGKRRSEN